MPELIPAAPGTPEWLAARRQGVTATDIVTILGLSSWDSAYSLYWRKLGQVPETPDNDRFRLGRELEHYVVARWLEEQPDRTAVTGALYRHRERPWQMATLDRVAYTLDDACRVTEQLEPLEVKTWADADRHSWGKGQVHDDDGTLLVHDDQVPATVRAQVLWQMDVMDVAVGHVGVVFLPSGEFRSYTVEHEHQDWRDAETGQLDEDPDDCDVCADLAIMRAAGEEFMQRLRLDLPAPDPDASAATLAAVKARFARQPDKTAEVDGVTWASWSAYKKEADHWSEVARGEESKLREQAGEASVLTVDGQPVARRVVSESQVKAHVRHSDYLRRIVRESVTDEHTNGIGEQQ